MKRIRSQSRIRKRTFVVTGLILLAILVVGSAVAFYASSLIGPADLVRFTVDEGPSRTSVLGSGISLDQAESSNFLQDASFEPLVFRKALTIYSGDATTLTVSSEDASAGQYGDGFFDGASARVMTLTADGLALKKTARVSQYGINRVGIFQSVKLPGDTPADLAILAFARRDEMSLAVGEKGLVIRNLTGQMPEIAESGLNADLTGACATTQGFLVCSSQGDLLFSVDGQDWQSWFTFDQNPLNAVAASTDQDYYVAVGDHGKIVTGQTGQGTVINSQTTADLHDIAYGDEHFVAAGQNGTILVSGTGAIWRQIQLPKTIHWQAIDFRDGRFVLAGNDGAVAISEDGKNFRLLDSASEQNYTDIVMLSKQQLIVLDEKGGFAVSNNSGSSWLKSGIETGMQSRVIALAGKDKILSADAAGNLGLAQLVAEIQLDSPLKEGQYQAGDLIFLEKTATSIPDSYLAAEPQQAFYQDPWDFFGNGGSRRTDEEAAPGGGKSSLLVQSTGSGKDQAAAAIASQVIDPELIQNAKQNEVFQIELWMKQSDVADRSVQVWLSGPFKSIGTTFTNVGATWKKYSYTFVLPIQASGLSSRETRLNISINSGSLWLDRISLFRGTESSELLSASFQTEISQIQPEFVRLGFLSIGGQYARQESWAAGLGNENPYLGNTGWTIKPGNSMYAALKLVKSSGADPWLVIDSFTSEAEMLNLIEYLAGPISEPYGKIRLEHGAATPWTEQFNRILIEIADSVNVLQSDQQRADFVNLMIQTISQSPYYRQIKGKLVFVDGMTYSDGVVLSTADYHASDLTGLTLPDKTQAISDAFLAYYDQIPRNPEKLAQNWSELMRTAQLRQNGTTLPDLAALTELLLRDLGNQSNLSNLALPARDSQEWQKAWPAAASIAAACAEGVPLEISDTSVAATAKVNAYGFKTDQQVAIALTNLSDTLANCQLNTELPIQKASVYKYDAQGELLSRQTLKKSDSRITVLPGGVVLIVKDLTE